MDAEEGGEREQGPGAAAAHRRSGAAAGGHAVAVTCAAEGCYIAAQIT